MGDVLITEAIRLAHYMGAEDLRGRATGRKTLREAYAESHWVDHWFFAMHPADPVIRPDNTGRYVCAACWWADELKPQQCPKCGAHSFIDLGPLWRKYVEWLKTRNGRGAKRNRCSGNRSRGRVAQRPAVSKRA